MSYPTPLIDRKVNATPIGTVYFSAVDRQAQAFLKEKERRAAIERSLLLNVLFEEAVLIPDVFFFISQGLVDHVSAVDGRVQGSLLEAAISAGIVIPALRESYTSFAEAHEDIRQSASLGLLELESCERLAAKLDIAAGRAGASFKTIGWSYDDVGNAYGRNLVKLLQPDPENDVAPDQSQAFRGIWEATRIWRHVALNEAKERGGAGFRRGMYMTVIGESLGMRGVPINDISQLFVAVSDEGQLHSLKALCYWMNECYVYSQARSFGAIPSMPNFHPKLGSVLLQTLEPPTIDAEANVQARSFAAKFPPPHVLLAMDPQILVSIRSSSGAAEFFIALKQWRNDPSNERLASWVSRCFENYGRILQEAAYKGLRADEGLIQLVLANTQGPSASVGYAASLAASSIVTEILAKHQLKYGIFAAVGAMGYATFRWVRDRPRGQQRAFRTIELNLPQVPAPGNL